MHEEENYQPQIIIFTVKNNEVPASLGEFGSDEEARLFMAENLLATSTRYMAERYMDKVEVAILRDQYQQELEETLPALREAHRKKKRELEAAIQQEKEAAQAVTDCLDTIQHMADKAITGVTGTTLDLAHTWKLIYNGKKYIYTYNNGAIQLAGTEDVSSYEINDLTAKSERNKSFFEEQHHAVNGKPVVVIE